MRILEEFGEPISYGGQESFVMNVLESMDPENIEADLLSPYYCDNKGIINRIRARGGEVYTLGCSFRPGRSRNNTVASVRDFLKKHSYDVIHIHSGSNSMLAILSKLASEAGIPGIIVHSHCTGKHGPVHFLSKTMTAGILKKYPTAYCSCSPEAGEWRFPRKICREQLDIINNGIDINRFRYDPDVREKMRSGLGLGEDTVLIACVGRLSYQKNQEFLIDVLRTVMDSCSGESDYRLILIGNDEERVDLETKAAAEGVIDQMIFTGPVDNVQDYLQAADVAVMPSRYEGLAIAAIEEQAAGLELLASEAVSRETAVTGSITFLPADDKIKWACEIMKPHSRHPEQADQVYAHGYSIAETASAVRRLYLDGQMPGKISQKEL